MKSTFPKLLLFAGFLLLAMALLVLPLTVVRAAPVFQEATPAPKMTAESLSTIAGVLLSLALAYIPKLNDKYNSLDGKLKALVFLGLLALAALVNFGLSCAGVNIALFGEPSECTSNGAVSLANAFIAAMIGGAGAYVALVRPFKQ